MTDAEIRPASRTALFICAYRARATAREGALINDPWAAQIAGKDGMALADEVDRVYPHMELWTAVRTAYLDSLVRHFIAPPESFTQVVLLGAGFDTRAARLSTPGVKFFEVDHTESQAQKRARVFSIEGYPRDAAELVLCDFEKERVTDALARSSFDPKKPAIVLWEGVTPYLPEEAVRATVRALAENLEPKSVVVFDHLLKKNSDPNNEKLKGMAQGFVAELGEPVRWGSNDPLALLYEEGMRWVKTASFDELCLALTGTYERDRQFRFQRVAMCSRTSHGPTP
jgi:methyltransferase (TIGR00027 family)